MTEEIKKRSWQGIRDFILGGTFLACLGTLWQMSAFVQSVKDFESAQQISHTDIEIKFSTIFKELDVLREWKVSTTQKPFYPGNNNASR